VEWYFKTSNAELRMKINVIKVNAHKYSVSAMGRVLKFIEANFYYYEAGRACINVYNCSISFTKG